MIKKFPETSHVLVIHSPGIFAKDLQKAIPKLAGGTVKNGQTFFPTIKTENMWLQLLYKRKPYAYQKEFRFVIINSKFEVPFSFEYENHSKMTMLEIKEIEEFIKYNSDKDTDITNQYERILDNDNRNEDVGFISDLIIDNRR